MALVGFCKYERIGKPQNGVSEYRCSECGDTRESRYPAEALHRRCPAQSQVELQAVPVGIVARILTYREARKRWKAAGKPVRSKAEVQRINDTICVPCEHYDPTWKNCRLCGCNLSRSTWALLNKIRWATEHCPIGKWDG